ncbi:MAG: PDZ domain-containing protein [Vicinamibacterales bacterium]
MRADQSRRSLRAWLALALLGHALAAVRPGAQSADAAWQAFWRADSTRSAVAEADKLLATGITFDDAYARLKAGRTYGAAPTGERSVRISAMGGVAYDNTIDVPAGYDPARKWPLRVQLHGSVDRQNPEEGRRSRRHNPLTGEPQIVVEPFGWGDSAWWHVSQVDNILGLVDRVKRQYNVDESQIYLTGTSDGGTGTYYLAMREPTLWSACLPLIGHLGVLANPTTGAEGELFVSNLVNRPFFVVNGLRDPKYPAARIARYIDTLRAAGVSVVFRAEPTGGHDTSWWPSERALYERFVHDHPRMPHPPLLSWETERTDRFNRVHWLVIDALGARPSDVALADTNTVSDRLDPEFGLRGDAKKEKGTRIVQVLPDTNAARMGLREGDRILEIDGRPVSDIATIVQAFERNTGPAIVFLVDRAGERLTLEGPFPPQAARGPERKIFARRKPSGRVDVLRNGNTIEARTRGVARFTLLLSPDVIDFAKPVVVTVNGRPAHDAVLTPSVRTLLTWAAKDNDRTMLYGAALPIAVP